MSIRHYALVLGLFTISWAVRAEDAKSAANSGPVSYQKQIAPILQRRCAGCHQPARKGGGLVLTSHAFLLKGGKAGPCIDGKSAGDSVLLRSLTGDGISKMPKGEEPLAPEQIDLIRKWISQGAKDDTPPAQQDTISAERPPVYESKPLITALCFSRDGSSLAVGGYREVLLHKADGSQLKQRLIGLSQRITSIVYSPDNKFMAVTGGSPGRFGELQLWETATGKLRWSAMFCNDTLFGASWSSDGSQISFGCPDNNVRIADAKTGKQTLRYEHHTDWVIGTCFSLDNKHMVSVSRDRAVKLTLTELGSFIDNITSITPGALTGGLEALDRHPKENTVAVGGVDGVPKVYKMFRTQARQIGDDYNLLRTFEKIAGKISCVHYNPDASLLAAAGTGEVRIYNTADGKTVTRIPFAKGVYAVAFHPSNGTIAAGGYDGIVKIADAKSGKILREFVPVPLRSGLVGK